jgi:hypothetical protein
MLSHWRLPAFTRVNALLAQINERYGPDDLIE